MSGVRVLFQNGSELSGLDFKDATRWILTDDVLEVLADKRGSNPVLLASFYHWENVSRIDAVETGDDE